MLTMRKNWDIFCRVIDNFGDIGVCWRLARQLAAEHGVAVRLWLDDLGALNPLCPAIDPNRREQTVAGVAVHQWSDPFPQVETAPVVIEAFACELPPVYRVAMARCPTPPVWINLEYLSAEPWVEGCHALASPQPPLDKHFFFPGFTAKTGGLLRESGLLNARDAVQARLSAHTALEVSLFFYDTAPVEALLSAWQRSDRPIRCRVPSGQPLAAVRRALGGIGPWQTGALTVTPIPFLPQDDYDRLLWECDLNFVRGEDSFVRAQWAGRPLVWQAYRQDDEAHLNKLSAFLSRYTSGLASPERDAVKSLFLAWNRGEDIEAAWSTFSAILPALKQHAKVWAKSLCAAGDLAGNLVKFVNSRL